MKYVKLGGVRGLILRKCARFLASKRVGMTKNPGIAVEYFGRAIRAGNALAMNNLGIMYLKADGVDKDSAKSIELFQKAAERGDPMGSCTLGFTYQNGVGVPKDLEEVKK